MSNMEDRYLTTQEVMKILHIASASAMCRLIRREGIPCIRIGKRLLFNRIRLERWLESRERHGWRELNP